MLNQLEDNNHITSPVYTRPLTQILIRIKVTWVGTCKQGYIDIYTIRFTTTTNSMHIVNSGVTDGEKGLQVCMPNLPSLT